MKKKVITFLDPLCPYSTKMRIYGHKFKTEIPHVCCANKGLKVCGKGNLNCLFSIPEAINKYVVFVILRDN